MQGSMRTQIYERELTDAGPIVAALDAVSEFGTAEGWAIYEKSLAVCHIQVRLGGVILGEDMADKFRLDLLEAGLRHGYCAFYAYIPLTRSGYYPLELVDGRTGNRLDALPAREIFVPPLVKGAAASAARSAALQSNWTDEQVLEHVSCLQLDANLEHMGPERFVDAVFRFALGRWADERALDGYCGALRSATITPTDVFRTVMTSEERKQQSRRLPSPVEKEFPFECDFPTIECSLP